MSDNLAVLFHIARILSESRLPIVFKGSLITKSILDEKHFTAYERITRDIDGCWLGPESTI
jgi:hypothetical protein